MLLSRDFTFIPIARHEDGSSDSCDSGPVLQLW
jgi:hypothetical protein